MATNASIQHKLLQSWNRRDFETYESLLHPNYSYVGGDGKVVEGGPKVGVGVAKMYADAFPDGVITVTNTIVSNNMVVTEFVCTGSHGGSFLGIPATGKPIEIHVCNIMEIEDGQILREREYMDMASLLRQVGVRLDLPGESEAATLGHA